jgi:hypothetical protein
MPWSDVAHSFGQPALSPSEREQTYEAIFLRLILPVTALVHGYIKVRY